MGAANLTHCCAQLRIEIHRQRGRKLGGQVAAPDECVTALSRPRPFAPNGTIISNPGAGFGFMSFRLSE